MIAENEGLKLQVTLEIEKNKFLSDENTWLKEQLSSLQRNQFGKKSERWKFSEKLKYEPAKISVIQYHRSRYGEDAANYVKTTPPVPSIIPQRIATPELLTAIIIRKYADGLPLYRMEDIFLREGIDLSRRTMARSVVKVEVACRPIWTKKSRSF